MAIAAIDRIAQLEKGKRVVTEKFVRPDEEYFQDHFMGFPVLPGVMMLEGMVQSASWIVREAEGFASAIVSMVECSQAKYSKLVRPGAHLVFEAELAGTDDSGWAFKAKVSEDGKPVALARFKLRSKSITSISPLFAHLEKPIAEKHRRIFERLSGSAAAAK